MALTSQLLPMQSPNLVVVLVPFVLVILLVGGLALQSLLGVISSPSDSRVAELEQRVGELEDAVETLRNE
jgi:hypothetical protein